MSNYQNHLVDPTFFYDAIEEFAFDYDLFREKGINIDNMGRKITKFEKTTIRGSLQSHGKSLNQSISGNTQQMKYDFYCKSLYRINIGDFIFYKNRWLHVDSVNDYDEWGVRSCSLTMIQLTDFKDLAEYVKYLEGEMLV